MILPKRVVARRSLAFVAALAVTATLSVAARAQEPGAPPVTTTTAAPPAPTATAEAPPAGAGPSATPRPAAVEAVEGASTTAAARLAISATVGAGPFLVGERIPVEVTVSNTGDADATGVRADGYSTSGSTFLIQSSEWGDLATWPGPGITLPAGQERVLTVRGEVQGWSGAAPVAKFSVWQGNASVARVTLPIPVRDPDSAKDALAGLVYGDLNHNGTPDAGEALQGVRVAATTYGSPGLEATTGADGRFRFADLPVRVYRLATVDVPDGWIVEPLPSVAVDGSGSAANVLLRGERPLTDVLSASMEFTRDVYAVGDRAEVAVTLTNSGAADLTGMRANCDRANEGGPELRDLALGDLAWDGPGVTVPAGASRVFTISGTVSAAAAEYGAVDHICEFGPREGGREGRPGAYSLAKVPGPAVTFRMIFHHDRDQDGNRDPDEAVPGAVIVLRDAVTGRIAADGRTDAQGRVRFENLPPGPYRVRVYRSWKVPPGDGVVFAGTCAHCREELSYALLPGLSATPARPAGG